jgi:hypothetical protein
MDGDGDGSVGVSEFTAWCERRPLRSPPCAVLCCAVLCCAVLCCADSLCARASDTVDTYSCTSTYPVSYREGRVHIYTCRYASPVRYTG